MKNLYGGPNQNIRGGVKPNGYSITVIDRGGSSQMIMVDYIGGAGSKKNSKNDYVILEQPLIKLMKWILGSLIFICTSILYPGQCCESINNLVSTVVIDYWRLMAMEMERR